MSRRIVPVVVICILGSLGGCISPAVHRNVPQFADAVTLATENSKGAFQVVDQKYVEIEADTLVVDYEKTGFDPRKIRHLLTADEELARSCRHSSFQAASSDIQNSNRYRYGRN